jgi:putative transcriptional regulator
MCLAALREMELIGEALFDGLSPVVSGKNPPSRMVVEPAGGSAKQLRAGDASNDIPRTLRHVLGTKLDAVPWIAVAPGIQQHVVPLSAGARGDLRALKLAAGATIPQHGHRGEELTLVLRGGCRDAFGVYVVGDLMDLDDEAHHEVFAHSEQGCILIVASEHQPQFARTWHE